MKERNIIALLTDFGTADGYVAAMKGVILSINASVRIVDISHEVVPQDVMGAQFVLRSCFEFFPDGTVFVAVVDPGVGDPRKLVCVETKRHVFLAPDNGILGFIGESGIRRCVELHNRKFWLGKISGTFHGRDILAPVAAHITQGKKIDSLGPRCPELVRLDIPRPRLAKGHVTGEVVRIDRFGNLITNISQEDIGRHFENPEAVMVRIRGRKIHGISASYSAVPAGKPLAIIGSSGLLELSVNCGDARKALSCERGEEVMVK